MWLNECWIRSPWCLLLVQVVPVKIANYQKNQFWNMANGPMLIRKQFNISKKCWSLLINGDLIISKICWSLLINRDFIDWLLKAIHSSKVVGHFCCCLECACAKANKENNHSQTCFENKMQFNKTKIQCVHLSRRRAGHIVHLFSSSHLQSISGPLKTFHRNAKLFHCIVAQLSVRIPSVRVPFYLHWISGWNTLWFRIFDLKSQWRLVHLPHSNGNDAFQFILPW